MTKIVLQDLASLTNETSALNTINANSNVIETASDSFLSRDGTTPNHMLADLDMNSQKILNIGDPLDMNGNRIIGLDPAVLDSEPVTLGQFNSGVASTGAAPANVSYITANAEASLVTERVLTAGNGITRTDGGANSTITIALDTTNARNKLHPTSTDNAMARYDGTSGDLQNSGIIVDDSNNLTTNGTISTLASTIAVVNADPKILMTDTDTNAIAQLGGSSSVGSLFLAADINDAVALSNMNFYIDTPVSGTPKFQAVTSGSTLQPGTNDGFALGSGTNSWSDLFLANGGVINFNNGNVALTHSSGSLNTGANLNFNNGSTDSPGISMAESGGTNWNIDNVSGVLRFFEGVTERHNFTTSQYRPNSNDGIALGNGTQAFSDLFLANGGVLNFNNGNYTLTHSSGQLSSSGDIKGITESFIVACSDETTALTTGTNKVKFRMPYAFTVTAVRASLSTAQTSGSIFTVDINESGTSIISTKLTIDNTELTSTTAATAAVISDSSLADDAEMSVDIDQIGDGTAKGLKITIIGKRP